MLCLLQIFAKYCAGELNTNPWSEAEGLQPETVQINDKLVKINSQGFLTINSQPAVNGEKSDSPSVGMCAHLSAAIFSVMSNSAVAVTKSLLLWKACGSR